MDFKKESIKLCAIFMRLLIIVNFFKGVNFMFYKTGREI
jgi:hypothetical protein